jgi:hypothetical protein
MRDVFPTKYYRDEGFIEYKIEINEEDLPKIIEEYLMRHADFDFDEVEIENNRPFNIWLTAKCRRHVDPDEPEDFEALDDAEVEVRGDYDGNPTGA